MSTSLAKGEKRTSSFPAHVLPRRYLSPFLRPRVDEVPRQHGYLPGWGDTARNVCSQALADEMADGWEPIMLRDFTDLDLTQAFLGRASPPVGIDDSEVMAVISIDDVCASLKRLKRGKAA